MALDAGGSGTHGARPQADVVASHIREHLLELKTFSQYAIALDSHIAPPPSTSHDRELLAFQAEDVVFLTEYVNPSSACAGPPSAPPPPLQPVRQRPRAS